MIFSARAAVAAMVSFGLAGGARADEGMWTYDNFPAAKVKAAYGWAPDQAWLDHARLSSVRLAQGCSASFVSPQGLVMTNHHCARACIDALSDGAHDYVAHGFYAAQASDEKSCPNLEANQLIGMRDVTAEIVRATKGLSGQAFAEAERAAKSRLTAACATGADLRCQVITLYQGGVYDLYTYKRYQDLRLVWAAEDAAANFGGDPDNFNFPRYAIDAAFVRVYDHGAPLKTANYLAFADHGPKAGDLVFTSGNPGTTQRGFTVSQLGFMRDTALPFLIPLYSEERGMLHQMGSEGAEQRRISLDTLYFDENSLKAYKGEEAALVDGPLMAGKQRQEAALRRRVAGDPRLAAARGAWDGIAQAVAVQGALYPRYTLEEQGPLRFGSALLRAVTMLNRYAAESGKPDGQRLDEYAVSNLPAVRQIVVSSAPVYPQLDTAMIGWWLTKLREDLGADDPDVHAILGNRSPEQVAQAIVGATRLADPALRARLFDGGAAAIDASDDPMLVFARVLDGPARAVRRRYENEVTAPFTRNAALIAGAKFALDGRADYPDATFSLRLSYGAVKGYEQHGRQVAPFTDFAGAYARATGSAPFALPASWVGAKATLDPRTPLDMASTDDITGGNSGSPVIDRDGHAAGLVFDGNIQSLGGEFGYDPAVNRTVSVDITAIEAALGGITHADRLVRETSPR